MVFILLAVVLEGNILRTSITMTKRLIIKASPTNYTIMYLGTKRNFSLLSDTVTFKVSQILFPLK